MCPITRFTHTFTLNILLDGGILIFHTTSDNRKINVTTDYKLIIFCVFAKLISLFGILINLYAHSGRADKDIATYANYYQLILFTVITIPIVTNDTAS